MGQVYEKDEFGLQGKENQLVSLLIADLRGQILLSEQTWNHISSKIETGLVNEVNAKGQTDPLRFCELRAITSPTRLELLLRENHRTLRNPVCIPVSYQLLQGKSMLPDTFEGEVINISYGGMLVNAGMPINPFADIKMSVNPSPIHKASVDLYSKAMYV